MAINEAGLTLVKHFEGLVLKAYVDAVGVLTIGWGHTGKDVRPGLEITEAQASKLLADDLALHETYVRQVVKVKLNDNQVAALTSFAFNVGNGSLNASTLLKKLNASDFAGAANEFERWVMGTVKGVKKVLPGLVLRRKAEAELFRSLPVPLSAPKMEVSPVETTPSALESYSEGSIPLSLLGGHHDLVLAVQKTLTVLGYLDPPSDGKFGPASHWALEAFCYAQGLSLGHGFTKEIAAALAHPAARLPDIKPSGDHKMAWFDRALAYMQAKGHWICRHPDCVNILYLEGVNPDGTLNNDAPNVFNDLRTVFSINAAGVPVVHLWEGTTEPGFYWTKNPMDPKGAARIAFGQYKSWIVGTHMAGKPSGHEALVQVEPVTVYRDLNKDYKRTGDKTDTGVFGINQHWGYNAPKNDLGSSSAGCLVGRSKDGHREFMAIVKADPRHVANPAYRFMATILPGDEAIDT